MTVRKALAQDMALVASLRWEWESGDDTDLNRDDFVSQFQRWAAEHADTHHCLILLGESGLIGMGWLAVAPRVPTIHDIGRRSADVQAVYVTPRERGQGWGGMLIDALIELAGALQVERVTVHSSAGAISAYRRVGFDTSPKLLQYLPPALPSAQ